MYINLLNQRLSELFQKCFVINKTGFSSCAPHSNSIWTLTLCLYHNGVLNSEVIQYVHTTVLRWEPDCYPYYDDFVNSKVYSGEVSLQYTYSTIQNISKSFM